MRVLSIGNDVNHYRYFLTEREDQVMSLTMDCTPRSDTWVPPAVFVLYPLLRSGDFLQFTSDSLILTPRATEALRTFLEMAGELLPLPHKGIEHTILNVTECIDCLDPDRTEWRYTEDGQRLSIRRPAFFRNRFTDSPLFKIPELRASVIFVTEGLREPDQEFRYAVEKAGLRGLVFKEIWSDGD